MRQTTAADGTGPNIPGANIPGANIPGANIPGANIPGARVPTPVRALTEALFAALARLRDARPFHPRGASFTATLTPRPDRLLDFLGVGPRPALVRLSNAAGLPARLPDVLGLGIRIPDGAGPDRPQDLLLSSSGEAPLLRHLLVPARGFDRRRHSSLLLYRQAGRLRLVGARYSGPPLAHPLRLADTEGAAARGALSFTLALCAPGGRWQPAADLQLHERLTAEQSQRLRFHPWNSSPQLRPVGALNHLRAAAYEAAQRTASSE